MRILEFYRKTRMRRIKNDKKVKSNSFSFLHLYQKKKIDYLLVIFDNNYICRIMKELFRAISYILIRHCARSKFRCKKNSEFCIGCRFLFRRSSNKVSYLPQETVIERKENFENSTPAFAWNACSLSQKLNQGPKAE